MPDSRKTASIKPQIIKRRPAPAKAGIRAHSLEKPAQLLQPESSAGPSSLNGQPPLSLSPSPPPVTSQDELAQIRALLRPPEIEGVADWGIPPPSTAPCDPALEAKLAQFHSLKRDPVQPKHFNDALMTSRAFRNPHLYTKLVEFVDVDERASNFPRDIWDPHDVQDDWLADRIAEKQKKRTEEHEAAQAASGSSKRTKIDFTSSQPTALPTQPRAAANANPYLQYSGGNMKAGRRNPRLSEPAKSRWA